MCPILFKINVTNILREIVLIETERKLRNKMELDFKRVGAHFPCSFEFEKKATRGQELRALRGHLRYETTCTYTVGTYLKWNDRFRGKISSSVTFHCARSV